MSHDEIFAAEYIEMFEYSSYHLLWLHGLGAFRSLATVYTGSPITQELVVG
jgi:hypothetical protein